jgi:hypothetical protein
MWQAFWSWMYAPYILYKIYHIEDVHYWRLQTTLCIIAGLVECLLELEPLADALLSQTHRLPNVDWISIFAGFRRSE